MRASWYNDLVQPLVVAPRIPRFASLLESCVQTNSATPPGLEASCFGVFAYRSATDNVLALANDIGNLENNHPCKQCIDTAFENTIDGLTELAQTVFGALAQLFAAIGELEQAQFHASIMSSISKKGVADFYHYYTVRQLYAQLGAGGYIEGRAQLNAVTCPLGLCLDDITVEQAQQDLLNHADHSFSSSNTVGSPLPFWTEDGDGPLGLPLGQYSPTGGSGIDMSTPLDSVIPFLVTLQAGGMPTTEDIATNVFTNPIYVWFVAGVTNMTARKYEPYFLPSLQRLILIFVCFTFTFLSIRVTPFRLWQRAPQRFGEWIGLTRRSIGIDRRLADKHGLHKVQYPVRRGRDLYRPALCSHVV